MINAFNIARGETDMTIGEIIKDYRKRNNLSQREFALRCKLSNGSISIIERGVNPKTGEPIIPSLPTLNTIAKGMNITIDELLEQIGDTEISLSRTPSRQQNMRTAEFIRLFEQLSPEQQKMIIAQIRGILSDK
jgi:transcriptional regulator with XRE-family HTH domain